MSRGIKAVVLVAMLLAFSRTAAAVTEACDLDSDPSTPDACCLKDVASGAVCTANDLTFVLVGLGILDDGCTDPTDTVTIQLRAVVENTTAQTRYDVGFWVSTDGDSRVCSGNSNLSCTADADCTINALCGNTVAGFCDNDTSVSCTLDADCSFGTCRTGFCTNSTTSCSSDADCTAPDTCTGDGAEYGKCAREILTPPSGVEDSVSCTDLDLTCGSGGFFDADLDSCGDILNQNPAPDCGRVDDAANTLDGNDCTLMDGVDDPSIMDFPTGITFPCIDPDSDGFVELDICISYGNQPGQVGSPTCDSVLEIEPGTNAKCQCENDFSTNIPAPDLSSGLSCICDSPTTVVPGNPVHCTVSYTNNAPSCTDEMGCSDDNADCTSDTDCTSPATCEIRAPERFRCGTSAFISFDTTDAAADGTFAGICEGAGLCTDGVTACTMTADCSGSDTCDNKGYCSGAVGTRCEIDTDCGANGPCLVSTCSTNSDCTGHAGTGVCTANPSTVTAAIQTLNWTPTSTANGTEGIIGPSDTDSLEFIYTVASDEPNGAVTLTMNTLYSNVGECDDVGAAACTTSADCAASVACKGDFTTTTTQSLNATCALNVDATHVTIKSLEAFVEDDVVVVEWRTASEVRTLGFHLWRRDEATEDWLRVNHSLLPALQHVPGGEYRMEDRAAPLTGHLTYMVTEVDVDGIRHGSPPFDVEVRPASGLGLKGVTGEPYQAVAEERSEWMKERLTAGREARLEAEVGRLAKAGGDRAKVAVDESGIHFLGVAEIAAALGQPESKTRNNIRTGHLRLSYRDADVAWEAAGGDSGIFFYGEANDSIFSRHNVYWLESGNNGLQVTPQGGPAPSPAAGPQSFTDTVHLEEDLLDRPYVAQDPLDDYWFWDFVLSSVPAFSHKGFAVELHGVAATAVPATLTVSLHGFTNPQITPEHRAEIRVNGQVIGEVAGPRGPISGTLVLPQNVWNEGSNTVEVVGLLGGFFVDSFDVSYQRRYEAVDDSLVLRGDGNSVVTVSGLTSSDIRVYEISDPLRSRRIGASRIDPQGAGYQVSFAPASPDATYLVTANLLTGASVSPNTPSDLRDKRTRGEYLVIAPAYLSEAAQALADYRQTTGLSTLVVELGDVFDEFNDGLSDPRALSDFLAYAHQNWTEAPRYVALVGKGSYDYRNIYGLGDSVLPPIMVSTRQGLVASDHAYGDVDGDGLPEMAVGRLPVMTAGELQAYVDKIADYESSGGGAWTRQVLMVADDLDSGAGDFAADSDDLAALLPSGLGVEKIYLGAPDTTAQARQRIVDGLNQGAVFLNYVGHGGFDRIAAEGLLRTADLPLLQNQERLPIMAALTCNVGMYAFPGFTSFGERVVLHGPGGVAALWGPMGLSFNLEAVDMGAFLFRSLFASEQPVLGDAIRDALAGFKAAGGDPDLLRVYGLLGDPALVMK